MVHIGNDWDARLSGEFDKPYYQQLRQFLIEEYRSHVVYPNMHDIFNALRYTSFSDTKVVILGQDPYHNPGQAMGLSFSVPNGVPAPPSLKNIFKEAEDDLGIKMSGSPNLEGWARQGVLLLNAMLTVRAGEPSSHSAIGWQQFTDAVISYLSDHRENIVFMLWGNYARSKAALIDRNKHLVLEAAHPSPLARGAFFGSRPFSKANHYLVQTGRGPIDWRL